MAGHTKVYLPFSSFSRWSWFLSWSELWRNKTRPELVHQSTCHSHCVHGDQVRTWGSFNTCRSECSCSRTSLLLWTIYFNDGGSSFPSLKGLICVNLNYLWMMLPDYRKKKQLDINLYSTEHLIKWMNDLRSEFYCGVEIKGSAASSASEIREERCSSVCMETKTTSVTQKDQETETERHQTKKTDFILSAVNRAVWLEQLAPTWRYREETNSTFPTTINKKLRPPKLKIYLLLWAKKKIISTLRSFRTIHQSECSSVCRQ